MAEPIASFYYEFVSEGLSQLKDGLDDLNKKMDGVSKTSKDTSSGIDSLFAGFKKLLPEITLIGTAYKGLKTAMSLKDEIVDMQNLSTAAGIGADKVEGLGRALFQFGGNWQNAASLFGSITDMMEGLKWGSLDKNDLISKYGVDIVNGLLAGDHMEVLRGISEAMAGKDTGAQRAIAKGFLGGNEALQLFFGQGWGAVSEQLSQAMAKNFKSDPEYQRNSRELKQTIHELKESWERSVAPLMPGITAVLDALQPVLSAMQPLFSAIGNLLQVISPLVSWVADKIGKGIQEVADTINHGVELGKAASKVVSGEMSRDEFMNVLSSGKGLFGRGARAGTKAADWFNERSIQIRASEAFKDINAGTYDMADIMAGYSWLNLPDTQKSLSPDQIQNTVDVLRSASDALMATNNGFNTIAGGTSNSDNRTVNIGEINVYGDNSTAANIGNNIGSAVKNGITNTVLEPAYNTRWSR